MENCVSCIVSLELTFINFGTMTCYSFFLRDVFGLNVLTPGRSYKVAF